MDVYRAWLAIVTAGLLGGVAVVSLFVGFDSPVFLGVAAVSAGGGLLAYWYGRERMLRSVYDGVDPDPPGDVDDGTTEGGATDERGRTAQATDGGETTTDHDHATDYDDWTWAGRDPDDPFWSDDPGDWEDPWEWEATDPEEAARESRRRWRRRQNEEAHGTGRGRGGGPTDGRNDGSADGRGRWWDRSRTEAGRPTVAEAYEVLEIEPGADLESVRRAYRERAKETHPDLGGDPEAFIEVREAYERLRERLDDEG